MRHTQRWKRIRPAIPAASSSAEQPASRASEPASSAQQPARIRTHSTSMDALNGIRRCIVWADAEDYKSWKISNPYAKRKTISNLVGHLESSIRAAFHNSAEPPVPRGIPMEVLTAWLILKCDLPGKSIAVVKSALCDLANAEHRLFRMRAMVDKADALSDEQEFSADAEIDHNVLYECMRMCSSEVDRKKNALRALFSDSGDQTEYS